jgi:uncharacterized damage-inducible protein DinB
MDKRDLTKLVQYNFWANGRILATCEHISPDEFTRELAPDPGWGSLRAMLVHTLDAEYGWRAILQSQNADEILKAADFPDVAALKARWGIERTAWLAYMDGLRAESLDQGYGTDPHQGPKVWQTILHVVIHGVQHRSEAAAVLTGYGHSPGELDFDVFLNQKPA